jgi:hypothetical protein
MAWFAIFTPENECDRVFATTGRFPKIEAVLERWHELPGSNDEHGENAQRSKSP